MLVKMESNSNGGGASAPELVWANPNIPNLANTTFAAQTLNESSSGWVSGKHIDNYDGFLVLTHYLAENLTSSAARGETFTYIPVTTPSFTINYNNYIWGCGASATTAGTGRSLTVSNNGLEFGAATNGNTYCIPLYIWGVKGALTNS